MMSGASAKKIRLRTLVLLSCATGKLGDILAEALRRKLQCFDGCQVGKDCLAKGLCRPSVLERQHQSLDAVRTFGRKDLSAEQQPGTGVGDQRDAHARIAGGEGTRQHVSSDARRAWNERVKQSEVQRSPEPANKKKKIKHQ